jgi:hypothetical protein
MTMIVKELLKNNFDNALKGPKKSVIAWRLDNPIHYEDSPYCRSAYLHLHKGIRENDPGRPVNPNHEEAYLIFRSSVSVRCSVASATQTGAR